MGVLGRKKKKQKTLESGEPSQKEWKFLEQRLLPFSEERARDQSEPIGGEQKGAGCVKPIRDEMGGIGLWEGAGFGRLGSELNQSEPSRAG